MPRDPRLYITVHNGMPGHPKIEGLSDGAFRLLVTAWCTSVAGQVTSDRAAACPELLAAGLVDQHGGLTEWGAMFDGPFRSAERPAIPAAVRQAVYERDGHRCAACGATEHLSIDHILPWSRGGTHDPDNLQTLCMPCNLRKGARTDAAHPNDQA